MPSTAALLRLVVVSVGTVRAPDAQKAQADVWRNAEQSGALRAGGGVELVAFAPFNESVQGLQAASASLSESAAEGPRGGRALPLIADDASPCGRPSAACWRAHDNHSADRDHHVGQAYRQKSEGWWCAQQRPLAALNVVKRAYPPRTAEDSAGVDYYLVLDDDTCVGGRRASEAPAAWLSVRQWILRTLSFDQRSRVTCSTSHADSCTSSAHCMTGTLTCHDSWPSFHCSAT